jgi:DNA polymerase III delta prime subunit
MWSMEYEPLSKCDFIMNKESMTRFDKLFGGKDMCHQIIYGKSGCGKKCIVRTVIRERINIIQSKYELKSYIAANDNKTELNIFCLETSKHLEVIINKLGTVDKYLINGFLKEKIEMMTFTDNGELTYKIVVLYNIHNLTKTSQFILKDLLETYSKGSRFIMTTDQCDKIIYELKSRTSMLRVPCVREEELCKYMKNILTDKNETMTKGKLIKIIKNNENHIQNSIDNMQNDIIQGTTQKNIIDKSIDVIVEGICKEKPFKIIREELYKLIINNISGSEIIKKILTNLLDRTEDKMELYKNAAKYESTCVQGERCIYHIEAFIHSIWNECVFKKQKTKQTIKVKKV